MSAKLLLDYNNWLKIHGTPTPVETYPNTPAYSISPKDIVAFLNAIDIWDLFMKPNYNPIPMDYPTSALTNMPTRFGPSSEGRKPSTILFSNAEDLLRGLYPAPPQELQGIYEHEVAHVQDPRINPYKLGTYPNYGYTTFGGLSQDLLMREAPGMIAENKYYNSLKNKIKK